VRLSQKIIAAVTLAVATTGTAAAQSAPESAGATAGTAADTSAGTATPAPAPVNTPAPTLENIREQVTAFENIHQQPPAAKVEPRYSVDSRRLYARIGNYYATSYKAGLSRTTRKSGNITGYNATTGKFTEDTVTTWLPVPVDDAGDGSNTFKGRQRILDPGAGVVISGGMETRGGWFGAAVDLNVAYAEQYGRPNLLGSGHNKFALQELNYYIGGKVFFYPWDFLNFSADIGLGMSSQVMDFGGDVAWNLQRVTNTSTGATEKVMVWDIAETADGKYTVTKTSKTRTYKTSRGHYNSFGASFGATVSYLPLRWLAIEAGFKVLFRDGHDIGPFEFKTGGHVTYHIGARFIF